MSELIALDGCLVWAVIVELGEAVRLRMDLSDWERLGLRSGVPVRVRRSPRRNAWLYLAQAVERPPVVWVVMARRAAGPAVRPEFSSTPVRRSSGPAGAEAAGACLSP